MLETRLRRALVGGVVAAAALAPAASASADTIGTSVSYAVHESTYDSTPGPSPGDTSFTDSDTVEGGALAVGAGPGWPLSPAPWPPAWTACTGGCADADAVAAGRADATGTLETFTRASAFGWGGHESFGDARTTARIDDTITVSKDTVVTLKGRLVADLVRRSSDFESVQDPDSELSAELRFGPCYEGCSETQGFWRTVEPDLTSTASAAVTEVDEEFAVQVPLEAGTTTFEGSLASVASVVGEENGSSYARADAHRNDDADRLEFQIVVPADVAVGSGSGKLPIVGGMPPQEDDTTPPTLQVPQGLTADATSPSGATVAYAVQATDDSGEAPAVTCSPASGSTFAVGQTTVTCVATDAAGNSTTRTFAVTVRGVQAQLDALRDRINQLGKAARTHLLPHLKQKCESMDTLRHQIELLVRKGELTRVVADELLVAVGRIDGALGC